MFPAYIGPINRSGEKRSPRRSIGCSFFSSLRDFHHSWNRWIISLIFLPSFDKTEEASESDSGLSDVSPFPEGGLLVSLPSGNADPHQCLAHPHKLPLPSLKH